MAYLEGQWHVNLVTLLADSQKYWYASSRCKIPSRDAILAEIKGT
jgi:hypothetical protein